MKYKNSPLILLLLFLAFSFEDFYAQNYERYWNYEMSDGLPSNSIYHLFVDSKGRIWFGSDLGVTCFDGQKFKTFTLEDGLSDNTVLHCFEDSKGRIWFHHNNKVPSFYFEGSIHKLKLKNEDIIVSSQSHFVEMPNGKLYIGCFAGIIEVDVEKENKAVFLRRCENTILHTYGKNGNKLAYKYDNYITHPNRILKLPNVQTINVNRELNCFPTTSVVYRSTFGRTPELTLNYIRTFKNKPFYRTKEEAIYNYVYSVKQKKDRYYYCTKNGLFIYKIHPNRLELEKHILKGIQIVSVDFDAKDNLWASSQGNGIYFLPNSNFNEIHLNNSQKISAQTKFKQSLLLGTFNGELIECDGKKTKPLLIKNKSYRFDDPIGSIFLNNDGIFSIETLNRKILCIGSEIFEMKSKLESYATVYDVKKKTFHYASTSGIFTFHGQNRTKSAVKSMGKVKALVMHDNHLYAATQNGIKHFTSDTTFVAVFEKEIGNKRVQNLLSYKKSLFISTSEAGLWKYDGKQLKNYLKKDGLLSNNITFLCPSKFGAIWIVSDIGLQEIKIENNNLKELRRIDLKTNIKSNEIIGIADIGNYLMLTTDQGLFALDIREKFHLTKMNLVIENVIVNNQMVKLDKRIFFDYGVNFKIVTSAINFTQHESEFFFRINKGGWSKNNSETFFFPLLSPGKYNLEIYSKSPFFLDSNIKTIRFTVREKWYQNTYLWIILFLLFLIGTILLLRFRSLKKSKRKRNELKSELFSLQSQMNPHFTFNSLNSIQSYMGTHSVREAQIYLADFAGLMRIILDQAKLNLISLEKEVHFLKAYLNLEKRRLENQFDYSFFIDESIDQANIALPTLLVQPFVENAIWHGVAGMEFKGQIVIRFKKLSSEIVCEIEDNGVGIEVSKQKNSSRPYHKSNGIDNCRQRIRLFEEIHRKKIELHIESLNTTRTGTIVFVSFPIIYLNEDQNEF